MKPLFTSLLIFTLSATPTMSSASDDFSMEPKAASPSNFDMPSLPTGEFTAAEEKERRAKAAEIAQRAQKRQNSKIRAQNNRVQKRPKRKVAGESKRRPKHKTIANGDF